jgi:hypothetical protein
MRIILIGTMPDSEVDSFLQAMRAWESGRPGVELTIAVDAPTLTREQARAMLDQLEPHLPHIWEEDPHAP